jgi:hypothetical protein
VFIVAQEFISGVKFAYLESNIKLQFVAHIMDADGPKLISLEDNDELGQLDARRSSRASS